MISVERSRQRPWWYGTHEATGCVSEATKNGVLAESITESWSRTQELLWYVVTNQEIHGHIRDTNYHQWGYNGDTMGIQWSLACCSAAPSQWRAAGHGLVLKPLVWQPLLITSEIAERKMQWTSNIFKTTLKMLLSAQCSLSKSFEEAFQTVRRMVLETNSLW